MLISVTQVVIAMAAGAIVPVAALLARAVLRLPGQDAQARERPPEPAVDDDGFDPVEAVARIVAAHFETSALAATDAADEADVIELRPVPEVKKRSASTGRAPRFGRE